MSENNWTDEQRAEYWRYLSSPAGAARRLVEAMAQIAALTEASNAQIAALKVDLAAMVKERDEARQEEDAIGANEHRIAHELKEARAIAKEQQRSGLEVLASLLDAEKARDAALLDASQARAERDEAAESVYRALCDGVNARVSDKPCEPPFDKSTPHHRAWLIGYGGQECADERDAAVARAEDLERAVHAACAQADEADAELRQLREENARLDAECKRLAEDIDDASKQRDRRADGERLLQALLSRAVTALQEVRRCIVLGANEGPVYCERRACIEAEARPIIDAILTDPTATAAVETWRELVEAAREVSEALCTTILPEHWTELRCSLNRLLNALAKVDARRGGK